MSIPLAYQSVLRQNRENKILWISAEKLPLFQAIYPNLEPCPTLNLPPELTRRSWNQDEALTEVIRSRLAVCGPILADYLAGQLGLEKPRIDQILMALENEGYVLRGRFTTGVDVDEWCERRLLARIHRYTIKSLRKQIEPVCTADFMRFLFRWQRLAPEQRMQGAQALTAIIEQMEGFEAAATVWESDLLRARINDYESHWLDSLCQSGKYIWARLSPGQNGTGPIKSSPIAFFPRRLWKTWRIIQGEQYPADLTATAASVASTLSSQGALFFDELQDQCRLLNTHLEDALAELVTKGLVSGDSFSGLRAMLLPEQKKRGRYKPHYAVEDSGRWKLLKNPFEKEHTIHQADPDISHTEKRAKHLEHIAKTLLKRYGVIFRAMLTRESLAPPWGELLRIYRRMEDRGEIRGGRFVGGQYGEQFALDEAITALRKTRKQTDDQSPMTISACDPLNLIGIIMPGSKLTAQSGNRILFQGGIPIAIQSGKEIRFLKQVDENQEWEIKQQLIRRSGCNYRANKLSDTPTQF